MTTVAGKLLKVHRARAEAGSGSAAPGTVTQAGSEGLAVQTGSGWLRLLEVQLEGRKSLPVGAFLSGMRVPVGSCLGGP
jgi:methionyl-tRNA formyltransferase